MQTPLLRPILAAAALCALLAGCNAKPTTLTQGEPADPTANQVATAPPVALPPSVEATKSYRCADNSLVFVDFMSDKTSANLRKTKDGDAVALTAPAAGQPYAGGGYTVSGSGDTATITQPGKSAQACTA